MKKILILLYLIICATGYAQTVSIKEDDGILSLAPYSYYLEDRDAKLTIEDISKGKTGLTFQKVNRPVLYFGVTKSVIWIKCWLRNETDQDIVVELGKLPPTDVMLYEFDSTRLLEKHHTGKWMPFALRETEDVNVQFKLSLKPYATKILYLRLLNEGVMQLPFIAGTEAALNARSSSRSLFEGMFYGLMLVMALYNLFLYFSLKDLAYFYYVVYILLMAYWNASLNGYVFKYIWPSTPYSQHSSDSIAGMVGIASVLFAANFLEVKKITPHLHKLYQALIALFAVDLLIVVSGNSTLGLMLLEIISFITALTLIVTAYIIFRKGSKPAGYFLIAWIALFISVIIFILKDFGIIPYNSYTWYSIQIGSAIEALLLSMALANRINIYKKEKEQASLKALKSLEENKKLITEQNIILERKVEERTTELTKSNNQLVTTLNDLKLTQTKLIQKEKMASLGELTAGIAHEIKNPLNFVNNFSDLSIELIDEMEEAWQKDNKEEALTIAEDIKDNLQKISRHGKRADAIVKGMLEHSRTSRGEKQPTNINALADEYLRLSIHGLRAKDNAFNAIFTTKLDESIGKIEVVPQDIGRVLLNLYNNAFYAANEKKNQLNGNFEPRVEVSTKRVGDKVELSVKDNGTGIPQKVLHKIYQPFFTTKPTGQGTGLGLSLSYDIITKGHGGEIKVETREGEGTEFIVLLPIANKDK